MISVVFRLRGLIAGATLAVTCLIGASTAFAADKSEPFVGGTVADALKVFDPAKIPLLKAEEPPQPLVGGFTYHGTGSPQPAYKFYQQELTKLKWKELPNSYLSEMSCSGTFSQAGYLISLSILPTSKPDIVMVMIRNHSNQDLKKLPILKGAKTLHSFPQSEAYLTELPKTDAATEIGKLLRAQKWEPYGTAGDVMFFKRQAIRLSVNVATAPAQGNKTVVTYSAEQMSADLPAPAETIRLQYSDSTKNVFFDVVSEEADIHRFYNETLAKSGWKPTLDKPIKIDFHDTVIYRNDAKDLLRLEMYTVEDKLRVSVTHQSAAEIEAIEAAIKADALAKKNRPKTENKPGVLAITLPAEAKDVETTKMEIKFNIADGKSKSFAESLRKSLKADGWKETSSKFDAMFGLLIMENGKQEVKVMYVETGVIPAEVTINGDGVELERVKAK